MAKQDELLNSNYDGIQEYDNDLPRWWLYLFYITIAFGVVYVGYYMFGPGQSQEQIVIAQLADDAKRAAASAPAEGPSGDSLLALASNQDALKKGHEVFVARCVACHGPDGQGLIGPNLTDKYWIHGGKITDLVKVVENGVLDKGMLAWKGVLQPAEIHAVVAYIWSIRGTNPANPKAPQGDLVE